MPTASWVVQKVFLWRLQNTPTDWFGVTTCLSTAVESARMIQKGSNLAQLIYDAQFARNICVCWNQIIIFSFMVYQRWPQSTYVWPAFKLRRVIHILWNIAQFVRYGLLLNLFFSSFQMDNWLLRYGHFEVWRGVGIQKLSSLLVYMPSGLCKLCVNFVFIRLGNLKCAQGKWRWLYPIWLHQVFTWSLEAQEPTFQV